MFDEIKKEYWSTDDRFCQKCTLDEESIACIVSDYVGNLTPTLPAGEVWGCHTSVPLTIHTFEDKDYCYVAHYINEVAHLCYLYRHPK
mgnify:CR=1 FL=1